MGITGLWDILGEGRVESIAALSARHLQETGRPFRIAIDEAGWRFHNLNDFKIAEIRKQEPRANPKEKAIFHRAISLLHLHVELIFIFDGPRRPWKRGRSSGGVKYDRIALLTKTLDALKIPHHRAPGEAEAECAKLQKQGIVDAVWSEDGDTLMFGCDYLLRTYRDGGRSDSKSKTHVRVHRADEIRARTGLDTEGIILFAMLSGGDYCKGIRGCGPQTAVRAAKEGFGAELCNIFSPQQIHLWRSRLQAYLVTSCRSTVSLPADFPGKIALKNYCSPIISSTDELQDFQGKMHHQWGRTIDENKLADLAAEKFNVSGRLYDKHIDPIFFVRSLARCGPESRDSNRCWGTRLVRSKKKDGGQPPELGSKKVKILSRNAQLFGEQDGEGIIECETLDLLLKQGLPEDVLDASSDQVPKRGRKRKAQESDETDSQNAPDIRNGDREEAVNLDHEAADGSSNGGEEHRVSRPDKQSRKRRQQQSTQTGSSNPCPGSGYMTSADITSSLLEGLPSTRYTSAAKKRAKASGTSSLRHSSTTAHSQPPVKASPPVLMNQPQPFPTSEQSLFVTPTASPARKSDKRRTYVDLDDDDELPSLGLLLESHREKVCTSNQSEPMPSTSRRPHSTSTSTWGPADLPGHSQFQRHCRDLMSPPPSSTNRLSLADHYAGGVQDMQAIDEWNDAQLQMALAASLQNSYTEPPQYSHPAPSSPKLQRVEAVSKARPSPRASPSANMLNSQSKPGVGHHALEVIDLCGD